MENGGQGQENGNGRIKSNGGLVISEQPEKVNIAPPSANGRIAKLTSMSTLEEDDVNEMGNDWKPALPFQNVRKTKRIQKRQLEIETSNFGLTFYSLQ